MCTLERHWRCCVGKEFISLPPLPGVQYTALWELYLPQCTPHAIANAQHCLDWN